MDLAFKTRFAGILWGTGMLRAGEAIFSRRPIVFALHRIVPQAERGESYNPYLELLPPSLDRFLGHVAERFQVVTLHDLLRLRGSRNGSKPLCSLTFDDGWEDNYRFAAPLLKRYSLPATIYLPTHYVGSRNLLPEDHLWRVWHSKHVQAEQARDRIRVMVPVTDFDFPQVHAKFKVLPYRRKQEILQAAEESVGDVRPVRSSFLDWVQVQELAGQGISFGSHTVHHCLLPYEDAATVRAELVGSRQELEARLGTKVEHFAYPSGSHNEETRRAVRDAGYTTAVTTESRALHASEDEFSIPRIPIDNSVLNGPQEDYSAARTRLHLLRAALA